MDYALEIYHEGECLEKRTRQDAPFPAPGVGDRLQIDFSNPNYTEEYGSYWVVRAKRHLFFDARNRLYTLQLLCEPITEEPI